MNFDNNHFISAGNDISGILYGTKPCPNSLYAGKGSSGEDLSTYSEQVYGYKKGNQPPATQRSNGYEAYTPQIGPVGSGFLYGGLDWVATLAGGYEAEHDGYRFAVWPELGGLWGGQLYGSDTCTHPPSKPKSFKNALCDAVWILTGKIPSRSPALG